jgi:hypothetical protein
MYFNLTVRIIFMLKIEPNRTANIRNGKHLNMSLFLRCKAGHVGRRGNWATHLLAQYATRETDKENLFYHFNKFFHVLYKITKISLIAT